MISPLLIALAAAPPGAAQWRVAALDRDEVAYVRSANVSRDGRRATFDFMMANREPEGLGWSDEFVILNCRTRKWRAYSNWTEDNGDRVSAVAQARARRGSFLGMVARSVCKGEYRSGPIDDPDRDAASRLAAGK
jgi:hypothetical protein